MPNKTITERGGVVTGAVNISLRLSAVDAAAVDDAAAHFNISRSEMLREALRSGLPVARERIRKAEERLRERERARKARGGR